MKALILVLLLTSCTTYHITINVEKEMDIPISNESVTQDTRAILLDVPSYDQIWDNDSLDIGCKHTFITQTMMYCPNSNCNTCTCMTCGLSWSCE